MKRFLHNAEIVTALLKLGTARTRFPHNAVFSDHGFHIKRFLHNAEIVTALLKLRTLIEIFPFNNIPYVPFL